MSLITRTPVLWGLFAAMILIGFGFAAFSPAVGGQYLDMISDPETARGVLAGMGAGERQAHLWVTLLLDTAYPLSFGLLFAGLAWRFFGTSGRVAAIPGFAVIIADLTENMIQALALSGLADVLAAKAWVTPLKFGLFALAAGLALIALGIALYRRFFRQAN